MGQILKTVIGGDKYLISRVKADFYIYIFRVVAAVVTAEFYLFPLPPHNAITNKCHATAFTAIPYTLLFLFGIFQNSWHF